MDKQIVHVLFEDNHLLVVEKPVNVPVQADSSNDDNFLDQCKSYIKDKYQKPGNVYLGLVHRLDRPVGGVMVFARTDKAAARLSEQIRTRSVDKTYAAIICGYLAQDSGTFTDYLVKDTRANMTVTTDSKNPQAKKAVLHYTVQKRHDTFTLVHIALETGRSHQIRVQFASRRNPLWGDQRYNANAVPGQQIALWATKLSFDHPITKERLTFMSQPPAKQPWQDMLK